MANVNNPNGFKPVGLPIREPGHHTTAASQTIAGGDPVYFDSNGLINIAVSNSTTALGGIAASPVSNSSSGDSILVWDDPEQRFEAQVSTGAAADMYTTATAASCFDLGGTTGIFYVNTAASSQDLIKVVGTAMDPVTGIKSATGAYQRKIVMINKGKHQLGTQS